MSTHLPARPRYWNHNAAFHDELVVAARILPGARVRRRFYWRYSLVWDRPMGAGQ